MKTVSKGVLKAKMLEYFREIELTGEELIVTNNNVPALKIIPIKQKKTVDEVFSDLRGKVHIDDSVMQPETSEWLIKGIKTKKKMELMIGGLAGEN